jgi:hypothetical protein
MEKHDFGIFHILIMKESGSLYILQALVLLYVDKWGGGGGMGGLFM